uniref:two-component regulator propeller domain-containing protein n=1 Tax=uncultured Draconibacterium sp. TaxID=1573823 RepID=UPI003216D622
MLRKCFIIFLVILTGNISVGNEKNYSFRKVSPPGGFTFGAINAIVQDRFDNLWLGTSYGLIRYDSENITKFETNLSDSTSLLHNVVTAMVLDKENLLWISTRIGLCYFNQETQTFTRIKIKTESVSSSVSNIQSMACDKNGNLWLVDSKGFGILNTVSHQFYRLKTEDGELPNVAYYDNNGNVWLGTNNGSVYKINPDTLKIDKIIFGKGNGVNSIYVDNESLWIGTVSEGVLLYSTNGVFKTKYLYEDENGELRTLGTIRRILKDHFGRLWIGTMKGLYIEENGELTWLSPEMYSGLVNLSIFDIFEDKEGGIWIGSWTGGLSYFHHANNQFRNYFHSKSASSISNDIVSCFVQKKKNEIYVGTEAGGLNLLNKQTGEFGQVYLSEKNNPSNIKCQCVDKKGGHWVGTNDHGLWYKRAGDNKFRQFTSGKEDGLHLSNNSVYALFPVDSGLWIGTHGGGVNFYNYSTNKITFYRPKLKGNNSPEQLYLRSIFVDSHNNLWLGTVGGLHQIKLKTGETQLYTTMPGQLVQNDYIFFISELSDGKIWMGTRGAAVSIYDPVKNAFSYFDANGLLRGKDVYGIIEDSKKNIWITSNYGLIFYNKEENETRRFTREDGVQGNWFYPKSIFRDSGNELYFGGTQGVSVVYPENLKINTRPPVATISKITINNSIEKYPYFRSTQKEANTLQLKSGENTLRIDFNSDNFLLPEKNRYKYRLINHYDEWLEVEKENSALFVNLPWGEYTFEVYTANNDGVWSNDAARFRLEIQKPVYLTNLALGGYLLVLMLIFTIVLRGVRMRTSLKKQVFVEKLQRRQEEEINEMKLKFFTNISHEFRTPLSLISGPAKMLSKAENLTKKQIELVDVISRNTARLLTLISQVIDLRKIDKKEEKLKLVSDDMISFIKEKSISFSNEAEEKKINFVQEYPNGRIEMDFDAEKMGGIIFNLLANAFKHTAQKGTIKLKVLQNSLPESSHYSNQLSFGKLSAEDYISVCISDTGTGIEGEDLMKIFNRFGQGKNKTEGGSGIGLSLCYEYTLMHHGRIIGQSTLGKGSRFIVQLPLKQRGQKIFYDAQEKVEDLNDEKQELEVNLDQSIANRQKTVLVVEDNDDFRKYLELVLSPHFKIVLAENGVKGIKLLQDNRIDIIVSDVMMPEMDGYEFCTAVKSNIVTSHIPVILLTALSSVNNKMIGIKKGADAYISKPFEDELLILQIKNLLLQREKLREIYTPKVFSTPSTELEGIDNFFLKKLNGIIEDNIKTEEFNIDQLVQQFGISRSQLHRKLKSLTGYSTTEYVRIYRLEKAVALMKRDEYNLDEIAFLVGFNTHAYFTRCFKNHYKMSPREYQKKIISGS